jgi:hypothetical protein
VVLGRAGSERSQRIIARIRYQVNNYLLDMYSNARAILGKGRREERAYPLPNPQCYPYWVSPSQEQKHSVWHATEIDP